MLPFPVTRRLLTAAALLVAATAAAETPAFRRVQHVAFTAESNAPILGGADLNGDGRVDLLVSRVVDQPAEGAPALLFLGEGNGRFVQRTLPFWANDPNFDQGASFAAADFDHDNRVDLVYAESTTTLRKLRALGGGDYRSYQAVVSPLTQLNRMLRVVTGDFDGSGVPDIAAIDSYLSGNGTPRPNSLLVAMNDGTAPARAPTLENAWRLVAADVTGDGRADLIAANSAGEVAVTTWPAGAAGFQLKPVLRAEPVNAGNPYFGANPDDIAIGDLDGDGKPDAVVHYSIYGPGPTVENHLRLLLNRSTDSVFAVDQALPLGACTGYFVGVRIGDFNGDGTPDIVTSCASGAAAGPPFAILYGRSAPGCNCALVFDPPAFPPPPYPYDVQGLVRGDYDGDGRLDIAVVGQDGLSVYLYDAAYDRIFADGFQAPP